ncbi:hypothetical protein ABBQ38_015170 [Trebouxia sp. C0009 RCD-2024]
MAGGVTAWSAHAGYASVFILLSAGFAASAPQTTLPVGGYNGFLEKIGAPFNHWAATLFSYIRVPVTATYTVSIASDNGAMVWIDDTLVVNNTGGSNSSVFVNGQLSLAAGYYYNVTIWYFQRLGPAGLVLAGNVSPNTPQHDLTLDCRGHVAILTSKLVACLIVQKGHIPTAS